MSDGRHGSTPSTFMAKAAVAAGERQHRADREVDVAGGDDVGQADGEQRELGIVEEDREGVGQVPPVVGPEIEAGRATGPPPG